MRAKHGEHFICISKTLVAAALSTTLTDGERHRIVGIGKSGTAFARCIYPEACEVPVTKGAFNQERSARELSIAPVTFDESPVAVDDLAVSGLTLEHFRQASMPTPTTISVGLLFKSRTTLARIRGDGDDITVKWGVRYSKDGGGNPPINSVGTLLQYPERYDELAERYFGDQTVALWDLLQNGAVQ